MPRPEKNFMKNITLILFAIISLGACKSKKVAENIDNLPKDISLKPENNLSQQEDQDELRVMMKQINLLLTNETCADIAEWDYTAIGAKPCGGPSSYIAYPKKLAAEILPKINQLSARQEAFNKKYRLMSDCMVVLPPVEIKCEEGKVVLVGGITEVTELNDN